MTKLRVCDISEGVSRVERGTLCVFVCVCVWYTQSDSHVCAQQEACSYPNGPCTDLIWSSSEKVLQLQGCIASLDDLAQGTGGEKCQFESRGLNCLSVIYCQPMPRQSSLRWQGPIHSNINSLSE